LSPTHTPTLSPTQASRNTNPSDFHNACWDSVAPLSGFKSRLEDNGTKSFFMGYDLNNTDFDTREDIDPHVMATPVEFAGNNYLPQVPIPENVIITKVYVSEVTLPKLVSGHYVKYYIDAHVFLAPLPDKVEIVFPAKATDDMNLDTSAALAQVFKKICHSCKKPGHTGMMRRTSVANQA
ncbi:hypothetical protein BGZ96_004643, partial [Linnemannia gamsii]